MDRKWKEVIEYMRMVIGLPRQSRGEDSTQSICSITVKGLYLVTGHLEALTLKSRITIFLRINSPRNIESQGERGEIVSDVFESSKEVKLMSCSSIHTQNFIFYDNFI